MRISVVLECVECKNRNYKSTKNKNTHPDRLEQKKYCSHCQKRTIHKETK